MWYYRTTIIILLLLSISNLVYGVVPIKHIIVIFVENRSYDNIFGTYARGNGFSDKNSPVGNCIPNFGGCSAGGTISLFHADPTKTECGNNDCIHDREAIIDSIDSGNMNDFGGTCTGNSATTCWSTNNCVSQGVAGPCVIAGSAGANVSGGYEYYTCTDVPFLCNLADRYGLADNFFSLATDSYPNHLNLITAGNNTGQNVGFGDAIDVPYTGTNIGRWTCDEQHIGGSQPVVNGTTVTGGYVYTSNVLSIVNNTPNETIDGIVIDKNHYYMAGTIGGTSIGAACVCDEGTTLPISTISCAGPISGTCNVNVAMVGATGSGGPSVGGTPGSLCINVVPTLVDLLINANVTSAFYAPDTSTFAYQFNMAAYLPRTRYTSYWTNNVFVENMNKSDFDIAVQKYDGTVNLFPEVTWLIPPTQLNMHPNTNITLSQGLYWLQRKVQLIFNSSLYNDSLIIITPDDYGGFYEHVTPPVAIDAMGFGPRVWLLAVGPYVKAQVNSTQYDLGSIIRCIEDIKGITPSLGKDITSTSLCPLDNSGMVNYSQLPILPPAILKTPLPAVGTFALN